MSSISGGLCLARMPLSVKQCIANIAEVVDRTGENLGSRPAARREVDDFVLGNLVDPRVDPRGFEPLTF
jgi:hypothetical protein